MTGFDTVQFAARAKDGFHKLVIDRVNSYFRETKISPYANGEMWFKSVLMLLLYFVPYVFIVTGMVSGYPLIFIFLWLLMGFGMIGIGTAVMHDALHGAISPNKKVNEAMGYLLEVVGGSGITWKIQHNLLHHTYTNIQGFDEDLDSISLLRMSPQQPRIPVHRYQYIYAWLFYTIMTLFWATVKDYRQLIRYNKVGLLSRQKVSFKKALAGLTVYKVLYYTYILLIPLLFSGMPWYLVLTGFFLMHFTAGFFLSCIFQPAHVTDSSAFLVPENKEGKNYIPETWAVHEVKTTNNFAPHNRFLTWFIGGLNYQIEHHLFSHVCHVHYPKLAPIVQNTANEFGIPYHVEPSFRRALGAHLRMLKKLGRE